MKIQNVPYYNLSPILARSVSKTLSNLESLFHSVAKESIDFTVNVDVNGLSDLKSVQYAQQVGHVEHGRAG